MGPRPDEKMTAEFAIEADPWVVHFRDYMSNERNASPHTIQNYLRDIAQFAIMAWGESPSTPLPWKEPDKFAARRFLVSFQKAGMKPATTARKLACLRSFYRFLERESYVDRNPFSGLRPPKRARDLPEVMSVDEIGRLLEAPEQWHAGEIARGRESSTYAMLRDTAILEVMYSTGARVSELAGITHPYLDLLSGMVRVRGKGRKERLCPLGAPATKAVVAMLKEAEAQWGKGK
ncbi:MAG: site-specific integrase, partial [Verrucomicrobia bacterium]|nr:site-specific integrase [Verrucomicrobiota bacterium]